MYIKDIVRRQKKDVGEVVLWPKKKMSLRRPNRQTHDFGLIDRWMNA